MVCNTKNVKGFRRSLSLVSVGVDGLRRGEGVIRIDVGTFIIRGVNVLISRRGFGSVVGAPSREVGVVLRGLYVDVVAGQGVEDHARSLADGVLYGENCNEECQKCDDLKDDDFRVDCA